VHHLPFAKYQNTSDAKRGFCACKSDMVMVQDASEMHESVRIALP